MKKSDSLQELMRDSLASYIVQSPLIPFQEIIQRKVPAFKHEAAVRIDGIGEA
jgi:hypothetical protein